MYCARRHAGAGKTQNQCQEHGVPCTQTYESRPTSMFELLTSGVVALAKSIISQDCGLLFPPVFSGLASGRDFGYGSLVGPARLTTCFQGLCAICALVPTALH